MRNFLKIMKTENLEFEYEELRENVSRNSNLAYLAIGGSITIAGLLIAQPELPKSTKFISLLILFIGYGIHQRFNYTNDLLIKRMVEIERDFDMWNHRIWEEDIIDLPDYIRDRKNKAGLLEKIQVHYYFLLAGIILFIILIINIFL